MFFPIAVAVIGLATNAFAQLDPHATPTISLLSEPGDMADDQHNSANNLLSHLLRFPRESE